MDLNQQKGHCEVVFFVVVPPIPYGILLSLKLKQMVFLWKE